MGIESLLKAFENNYVEDKKTIQQEEIKNPILESYFEEKTAIEREKRKLIKMEQIKEFTDNTKISGKLRVEINKGIMNREDIKTLLLKAIECISLMTGDTVFYEQNKQRLLKE